MSAEVAQRAFDPFFTTKDPGRGSGLGLGMVWGFVRQSGGLVRLESAPGRGTSVRLFFPRREGECPASARVVPGSGPSASGMGRTVLVVDDEPSVRRIAVAMLEGLGYRALAAADGPSALTLLAGEPRVDLLLTDVVLPGGLGGIALAREARRRPPGLRVLAMSGYPGDPVAGTLDEEPAWELLPKPFRAGGLAQAVQGALQRGSA